MNIQFNPVQCTSQQFAAIKANPLDHFQEGFLYFLTDTKQLFLAKNNTFIEMCGGVNIIYGNLPITYVNNGKDPDPNVTFTLSYLESQDYPLINDLILNSDGCFYRVCAIEQQLIKTKRLTLKGTGGGGGGGSSSGGTSDFFIEYYGESSLYFSLDQTEEATIGFVAEGSDKNNYIRKIKLYWDETLTTPFLEQTVDLPFGTPKTISINQYLPQIPGKSATIYLQVIDKFNQKHEQPYQIFLVNLKLSPRNQDPFIFVNDENIDYVYNGNLSGDINTFTERAISYTVYNNESIVYQSIQDINYNDSAISHSLNLRDIPHGEYTFEVSLYGYINDIFIPGTTVSYKMLIYDSGVGTPIFSAIVPENIQQYVKTTIPLMIGYRDISNYDMKIKIDGIDYDTQIVPSNTVYNGFSIEFETSGIKQLTLTFEELGIEFVTFLNVIKYSGQLPVINPSYGNLELFLTAKGQSNSSANKNQWVDKKDPLKIATLDNFYYGSTNGWLVDAEGSEYLKISQGASVTLNSDIYTPFQSTKSKTIELDFMISDIVNQSVELISCLSYDSNNENANKITGFLIQGDQFQYYASGTTVASLNLVQDERIRLTIVIEDEQDNITPMFYIYLNGIISAVVPRTGSFENGVKQASLQMNSNGGTLNLYNIRIYNEALNSNMILNNYHASLSSLSEREFNYKQNLVTDNEDISLALVELPTYQLKIPYVKIYGGYKATKEFAIIASNNPMPPSLPVDKEDFKAIDIEIIYPTASQNPYFANYKNFKVITEFDDPNLNVLNGFGQTPNTGAIMYAQGTSSLDYPVKNLRVKLKNNKFTVRPDINPVKLVTFKADYMESSGAHNTGAANYIDAAYASIGLETPGQAYYKNKEDAGTIVTTIKGHPCLIFWNPGADKNGNILDKDDPNNYQFIGKYNFNLDKATPQPFGFEHDDNDSNSVFGYETDEEGNLIYDKHGQKINSIYCFECLDNASMVANFKSDAESKLDGYDAKNPNKPLTSNNLSEAERFKNSWYEDRLNTKGDIVHGWQRGFESRHPDDREGINDADVLLPLAQWLNNLYDYKYLQEDKEDMANQIFSREYSKFFNKDFLVAYYVISEALLMIDSRVKNLMLATWGKEPCQWVDENGEIQNGYEYLWYPIFYDMDTMLGLDNVGYRNKDYYGEDTSEDLFNGDCILWEFVRDNLRPEIEAMFKRLEQGAHLSPDSILPYFNNNQADLAVEAFYNEDAFYKYIDPYRNTVGQGLTQRLYAAQGNRSLDREAFLNNRLRYLGGKYQGDDYSRRYLGFRLSANGDNNGRFAASQLAVPPSGIFNMTAISKGYSKVTVGQVFSPLTLIEAGETKAVEVADIGSAQGTETRIFGIENLSDIGDLSNKYIYGLFTSDQQDMDLKLKALRFGHYHPAYYNPRWGTQGTSNALSLNSLKLLEELNLVNCEDFNNSVDLRNCLQIRKILMTGSSASSIELPSGGIIEELRLPSTVIDLSIDSHPYLTTDKFTLGSHTASILEANESPSGELIEDYNKQYRFDVTYTNDFSKLTKLYIKKTLNLDSYGIIKSIVTNSNNVLNQCSFQDIEWTLDEESDFVITESKINGIMILDILKDKAPYDDIPQVQTLTGTLRINNVKNITVQEYALYEKYHSSFPNLNIVYSDDVPRESVSTINFYNTDTISSITKPYYTVLTDHSKTLKELVSADGPNGFALAIPEKPATSTDVYHFTHRWKDQDENIYLSNENLYNRIFGNPPSEKPNGDILQVYEKANGEEWAYIDNGLQRVFTFEKTKPTEDLALKPEFITSVRTYTVRFYDEDGLNVIKTISNYRYNNTLKSNLSAPFYKIHSKEEELDESQRYEFKGWVSKLDYDKIKLDPSHKPTFIEPSARVTSDMSLYPIHQLVNAKTVSTDAKYFNYEVKKVSFIKFDSDNNPNAPQEDFYLEDLGEQVIISLKPEYARTFGGRITLPNTAMIDGTLKPITTIGSFGTTLANSSLISSLYFLNGNNYSIIGTYNQSIGDGLFNFTHLKNIYIPEESNNIKYINQYALYCTSSLKDFPFNNVQFIGDYAFQQSGIEVSILPESIQYIGSYAFCKCGKLALIKLPSKLSYIYSYTFSNCPLLQIDTIGQSGDAKENNVIYIGEGAFNWAGIGVSGSSEDVLKLYAPLKQIEEAAFSNCNDTLDLSVQVYKEGLFGSEPPDWTKYFGTWTGVTTYVIKTGVIT